MGLKRYDVLAELGCIVCGQPAQMHHLIGLKYKGLAQKAKDEYTIPLCMHHHTGNQGIHQIGKKTWELKYGAQEELLVLTNKRLADYLKQWDLTLD